MNSNFRIISVGSFCALALASVTGCENKPANTPPPPPQSPARTDVQKSVPAADNTARNKGDMAADAKTPTDQSEAQADIKTTADIRRAIMDDKTMSVNAQNCKIITDKAGMVTLRGVVNSQAEKDSVAAKARIIAGDAKVDNQLEVKVN